MYKVVLVDDEILTREAIAENTPWEDAGFMLAGTAENGKDAIAIIDSVHPELVITDITMPVMDGLDLSKYIRDNHPGTSVIIISGYNEFEYAKRALSYGVMEYLLKPFTPNEFMNTLVKARESLSKKITKEAQIETLKAEKEMNKTKLQKLFVQDLLEGRATSRNLISQMENFGMSTIFKYQAVVFVAINNAGNFYSAMKQTPETDELLNFAIANIIGELIEGREGVLQFISTDEKGIYVFSADTKEGLIAKIKQMGRLFIGSVRKYLEVEISIIVGDTVENIADWPVSFSSAGNALKNVFSISKESFVFSSDINQREDNTEKDVLLTAYADKLIENLKHGGKDKLHNICQDLFDELRACHFEKGDIIFRIQNISFAMLMQLKGVLDPAQQLHAQNHEFFQTMQHCRHISELERQFGEFVDFIHDQVSVGFMSSNQKLAFMAKEYIENNYDREDLSLNDVCSFLGMSPSYFSVVYKNETGETFIETITRVRMERAKDLLLDSTKKNYEIAEQVGFADPHYFGSVFKKYTGMTPTEYAKKIRGEK